MDYLKHIIRWNFYYNKVWKNVSWWYDAFDSHVMDFVNYFWYKKWDTVLDVWCWYWKNAEIFIKKWIIYTWIDFAVTSILDAQKKYKEWKFILSNFLKFDFNGQKFDFIIDAWCIHVNDPCLVKDFLDKYYSILNTWWKLFIRIFKNNKKEKIPVFTIDNILPVRWYSKKSFINYIDKNKFKINRVMLDKDYYIDDEVFYFYLVKI